MAIAELLIRVPVAVARNAATFRRRISVASNNAFLAELAFRVVETFVALADLAFTRRVIVAAATDRAVDAGPTEVANALKVGLVGAAPVVADLDAGLIALQSSIAVKSFVALAAGIKKLN